MPGLEGLEEQAGEQGDSAEGQQDGQEQEVKKPAEGENPNKIQAEIDRDGELVKLKQEMSVLRENAKLAAQIRQMTQNGDHVGAAKLAGIDTNNIMVSEWGQEEETEDPPVDERLNSVKSDVDNTRSTIAEMRSELDYMRARKSLGTDTLMIDKYEGNPLLYKEIKKHQDEQERLGGIRPSYGEAIKALDGQIRKQSLSDIKDVLKYKDVRDEVAKLLGVSTPNESGTQEATGSDPKPRDIRSSGSAHEKLKRPDSKKEADIDAYVLEGLAKREALNRANE